MARIEPSPGVILMVVSSIRKATKPRRNRSLNVETMESRLLMATQVWHDEVPTGYPAELQQYNPITGFDEVLEVPQFNVANATLLSITITGDITLTQTTDVSTTAQFPVVLGATADLNMDGPGMDLFAEVHTDVAFVGPGSESESDTDTDSDTIVLLPGDSLFDDFIGAGSIQYILEGDGGLEGTVILPPVGSTTISIVTEGGGEITISYEYVTNALKSGVKYEDLNANGSRDPGELGLEGWTINLVGVDILGNPVIMSDTTDANGFYSFSVAPGTYTVSEVNQVGWLQSAPGGDGDWDIVLTDGQVDSGNDFANYRLATKTGVKFNDLNGDGDRDLGEPGLAGWTIRLVGFDGAGGFIDTSTVTGADGSYSFSVTPGNYLVYENLIAGWEQTFPTSGTIAPNGTIGYTIVLTSGQVDSGNDFGNHLIPPGNEGLTIGYWKNHTEDWEVFTPGQTLESVFNIPDVLGLDNVSLLDALAFHGGSGVLGGARNLLRQAVGALLNSAHSGVDYPLTTAEVIAAVNAALASGDRAVMLTLAGQLDDFDNLGADI